MFKWQRYNIKDIVFNFFFFVALVSLRLLVIEASWPRSETPHSLKLLWRRDQTDAETSTWQRTTRTRDKYLCHRRGLDSQFRSMENCLCCTVVRTPWHHVPCNNKDFAKLYKIVAKSRNRIIFKKISIKISAWLSGIFWTYRGMEFLRIMLLPSSYLMVPRNFVVHLLNCTVFIARWPIFDSLSADNFGRH